MNRRTCIPQLWFFGVFAPIVLMIGLIAYVSPLAEKLSALALLVAFGALFMILMFRFHDDPQKQAQHEQIVELLEEGNRLLRQSVDLQRKL